MRDKVGEVFNGKITGVTNFGVFVTLDDIYIEGLVHVSDLGEDYFEYRPEIMAMVGEFSGKRFALGDRVTVKVARADLDTSKIDLVLVGGGNSKRRKKAAASSGSSKSSSKAGAQKSPKSPKSKTAEKKGKVSIKVKKRA